MAIPEQYLSAGQKVARINEIEAYKKDPRNKPIDPELTKGHPVSYRDPEPAAVTYSNMVAAAAEEAERKNQPKFECYSTNPDDPIYRYGIEDYNSVAGKPYSKVRQEKLDAKIDEEMKAPAPGIRPNEPAASFLSKMAAFKMQKHREQLQKKLADLGLTTEDIRTLANDNGYYTSG